jgi:hypothetical protein
MYGQSLCVPLPTHLLSKSLHFHEFQKKKKNRIFFALYIYITLLISAFLDGKRKKEKNEKKFEMWVLILRR